MTETDATTNLDIFHAALDDCPPELRRSAEALMVGYIVTAARRDVVKAAAEHAIAQAGICPFDCTADSDCRTQCARSIGHPGYCVCNRHHH